MHEPAAPTWKGRLIALAVGLVLMAASAEGVLRISMPSWKEYYPGHFMHRVTVPGHASLYLGKPGYEGYFAQNNGDFRHIVRINDFGLRNDEPIDAADRRVWIIGDSMAFGWGVEREHMYSSVIARQFATPTYNIASPGTDACGYQGLAARIPDKIKPTAVIVGLILENDIRPYNCALRAKKEQPPPEIGNSKRSFGLEKLKGYLTSNSSLYNFLAVQLKRQAWINDALIAVGLLERPHKVRNLFPENQVETRTKATARELSKLRDRFPGVPFAVLVAPARFEIRDDQPFYRKLRLEMIAELNRAGLNSIDPLQSFKTAGFRKTHFIHDGHWSPLGHEVAAQAVARWLRQQAIPK